MLVNCCSVEDVVEVLSSGAIEKEIMALVIGLAVASLIAVKGDSGSVIVTV